MDLQMVQAFAQAHNWIIVVGIYNNANLSPDELIKTLKKKFKSEFTLERLVVTNPQTMLGHLAQPHPHHQGFPPTIMIAHIIGSDLPKDLMNSYKIISNMEFTYPMVTGVKASWPIYKRHKDIVGQWVMIAGRGAPLTDNLVDTYGSRLLQFRMQLNPLGHIINGEFHPFAGGVQITNRQNLEN